MDFPAYVPAAVRTYIQGLLCGDQWEPMGFHASLMSAESRLTEIEGAIKARILLGELGDLDSLRKQKSEAAEHRNGLASEVACLRRLSQDSRMRDAFALLTREFSHDTEWRQFIHAAWAARMNFQMYRDQLKRGADLSGQIADAAQTLAGLLRQFSGAGIWGPDEFYSIPELLKKTDHYEMPGPWQCVRPTVLGDNPRSDTPGSEPTEDDGTVPIIERIFIEPGDVPEIDPKEEGRNMLRYAWSKAPDLPTLLDTVEKSARSFKPSISGMIGAAIQSRQRSQKTEYLRGFGHLLVNEYGFTLTTTIMQAMAIVGDVVINSPEIGVTYDDVRKVMAKSINWTPEKSD